MSGKGKRAVMVCGSLQYHGDLESGFDDCHESCLVIREKLRAAQKQDVDWFSYFYKKAAISDKNKSFRIHLRIYPVQYKLNF